MSCLFLAQVFDCKSSMNDESNMGLFFCNHRPGMASGIVTKGCQAFL
jgi:hypothetical protein